MSPRLNRHTVFLGGAIETAIWAVVLVWLLDAWYPKYYADLFSIGVKCAGFLGVLFVLGAVLGALFYKPDEKAYANDLSVMFVVRLAVLAFGLHLTYSQRPLLVVFSVDRFVVVQAHQISLNQAPPAIVKMIVNAEEPPVIAARKLPNDDISAILSVMGGAPDIEYQPGQYEKLGFQQESFYERMCSKDILGSRNGPGNLERCGSLAVPLVYKDDNHATAIFDTNELRIARIDYKDPW
ncbi:hypothetical protein EHN06_13930 [Marinobacter sp. NP-4(2019)]|uniref:hypothetical protein n=1 Tax=Marinobacter sp. NP-4(2019) TaxID=2488665 RepID=UPI000FC3EFAD|nr:hypothetical protein [Marinobacter sp. NP-4(2019)]AZT84553.1 hypothetical protein EHN06_13930 [Marinobacter sp. NP-4(2019)]